MCLRHVLVLACAIFSFGCAAPASSGSSSASLETSAAAGTYLSGTSFAPITETAINDFIAAYGKGSPNWNGDAYVVSDFDNTTSIFDIANQCNTCAVVFKCRACARRALGERPNELPRTSCRS